MTIPRVDAAITELERRGCWPTAIAALRAAARRIGHGEYCNCAVSSGRHPDECCDCGKVETEKALHALAEEVERG